MSNSEATAATPIETNWFTLLWPPIAVLLLAIGSLLVPIPYRGRAAGAFFDLFHAPLFAGLTWALFRFLQHCFPAPMGLPLLRRSIGIAVVMFAFGMGIEWTQSRMYRSASWHDAYSNGFGILAATLCIWAVRTKGFRGSRWARLALIAMAIAVVALAWQRPIRRIADTFAVDSKFPLLGSFESRHELERWYCRLCNARLSGQHASHGETSVELAIAGHDYPTWTMVELHRDWTGMDSLCFDVTLDESYPEPGLELLVRVMDFQSEHDDVSTYRKWILPPGKMQQLTMARDEILGDETQRNIDLGTIRYVDFQWNQPKQETRIWIDNVRLNMKR